ncbi:MAG: CPBP family intramembrane glutamic endopeptidase [Bacteroidales bacterium]
MESIAVFFQQFEYSKTAGIALFCFGLGFFFYFIISYWLKNRLHNTFKNIEKQTFYEYIFQRILGFLFLGIFPAIVFYYTQDESLSAYGININQLPISLLWILILGSTVLILNFFFAGSKRNLQQYPQIQIKNWTFSLFSLNAITWILYLFSYELLFRGILLFSLYDAYGTGAAVILNTILYSLVHIPKGQRETLGAIPLGIILCLITIQTSSFFVAFAFHAIMAVSNDYFAIKYNPDMRIKLLKL